MECSTQIYMSWHDRIDRMSEEEMKMIVCLAMAKVLGAVWFVYVYFSLCDVLFDS